MTQCLLSATQLTQLFDIRMTANDLIYLFGYTLSGLFHSGHFIEFVEINFPVFAERNDKHKCTNSRRQ